ncbi:hypothetical protein DPMN_150153 [Dreissena polymorpha]|uniref:Uncharacterized protein n=1 Tax=Dreissena polymorpha TaxID=45954 RepID=A0A9D4FCS6_DREPO|nr:hypothetical protein DPMN_150153 [Dreissena polymorpha]
MPASFDIDIRQNSRISSWGECRASTATTFGKIPEYRTAANVEPSLTSTFGKSPEYRACTNVEPALTSTFGKSPEYRAGSNVEPALTSIGKSLEESMGRCIQPSIGKKF